MGMLIESYNRVAQQAAELTDKISQMELEIRRKSEETVIDNTARIQKLEEQLEKIDDYLLRIKGFQDLAKKNLDSQNVLTVEAPPGYRVNLNRLRNWAMMIDPQSSNDPYAQRVYIVAKCDEHFLEQKKEEFTAKIEQLKEVPEYGVTEEIRQLEESVKELCEKLGSCAENEDTEAFFHQVVTENDRYRCKTSPVFFENRAEAEEFIAPGAYAASLTFRDEQKYRLKNIMGDYYDGERGIVLLPVEISNRAEYVMTVTCAPSRRKKLDKAMQNLVLSTINRAPAGSRKVYVFDGVRFNSSSMGTLRQLEGTFAMEHIPRNPEQLTASIEGIVSSFADVDETIVQFDSVAEYNAAAEPDKRLPLTTILLFGWPNSFEGRDRELMQRIMTNYERYGVSIIAVNYSNTDEKTDGKSVMPEYALQNAIHVKMLKNETFISFADQPPQRFVWYSFSDELATSYVNSLESHKVVKNTVGNEYLKRYSLTELPPYTRDYKKIELPFGIDGTDGEHSVSFENENFATYLVGASRSGKSTLLHTLIAGLLRNYHPDNVELWLADFKQLEFKRYINHLPPHVKYVLLDESTELVFDLIDKLTNEMMERQKLFARLGVQRIDQVDVTALDAPLPVIFVILDEFSIMSQSIADAPIYKLKLQNILAKGAALGIKFLFSSQTFTTGVAGLTATARAQIQQRIAMKGSKEEISETLELSSNLKTEQVRNWMDALPPHYALVKFRTGADTLPQVKRYHVMYFKDYAPRDRMIDRINANMRAIEGYNPADINTYRDKHPVLVDGNSYEAFDSEKFTAYANSIKASDTGNMGGDEMFTAYGSPRLMESMKVSALSSETRENILLISRAAEQACAASVVLSAAKSFALQGGRVQLWAYGKNRLFRAYREVFANAGVEIVEGIDAVCDEIRALKQMIANRDTDNRLILMVGMDRICMDFGYVDGPVAVAKKPEGKPSIEEVRKGFEESGAAVSSEEDEKLQKFAAEWRLKKREIKKKAQKAGKSPEELQTMLDKAREKLEKAHGLFQTPENGTEAPAPEQEAPEQNPAPAPEEQSEETKEIVGGAYNAAEDFEYVLKQGSRLGVHFLLQLNNFADLKQCGLKVDYFRYRLAFQLSADDSRNLFGNKVASTIPEHICQYDDSLERYSFRPYLHSGISWDGWAVADDGSVISPYEETQH